MPDYRKLAIKIIKIQSSPLGLLLLYVKKQMKDLLQRE